MPSAGIRPLFSDKAKFVYDLGRISEPYSARITQTGTANVIAFTLSSSTEIVRVVRAFDSTDRDTMVDFPYPVSTATNDLTLIHAGDSAHYSQVYQFYAPIDLLIDRIDFNIGMGFNISAYSSGNFRMTHATVKMKSYRSSGKLEWSTDKDFTFTMTSMTAADNQIAVLNTSWNEQFPVYSGGMLEVYFDIFAATGVGTYQKGIIPIFPYQNVGGIREYGTSQMLIWPRPNPWRTGSVLSPATFSDMDRDQDPVSDQPTEARGLND